MQEFFVLKPYAEQVFGHEPGKVWNGFDIHESAYSETGRDGQNDG